MVLKHLFFPASFFPSIGGAQGSLINFLHCFGSEEKLFFALGLRSFFYSLINDKRFQLTIPYVGRILRNDKILKSYLMILALVVKPDIVWLYGGGELAARIIRHRKLFRPSTKFVIRSMGSDIQYDASTNYGIQKGTQEYEFITNMYQNADYLWALSDEIEKIYRRDIAIDQNKILQCGNCIIRPSESYKKNDNKKLNIGVIGRNHPKKNFNLLNAIIDKLDPDRFNFVLKTPGFQLEKKHINVIYEPVSNISNLIYWPPDDVWEFYDKVDVVLILSKVESFGNVTFEAGLSDCSIIINKQTTGGDIAIEYDFDVYTYNSFDAIEICDVIVNFKINKNKNVQRDLNKEKLTLLVDRIMHD